MKFMAHNGLFSRVKAVYPTVTNANNVSIRCGAWPKDHGITGNSYFDEKAGAADYMDPSTGKQGMDLGWNGALQKRGLTTVYLTAKC